MLIWLGNQLATSVAQRTGGEIVLYFGISVSMDAELLVSGPF